MGKKVIPISIILLLILVNSPSPVQAGDYFSENQQQYAYCGPPQHEENKRGDWFSSLLRKLPWQTGNNRLQADKASFKTNEPSPLIPNETGIEFKLLIRELASQIINKEGVDRGLTVVVTTFVDLDNLYKTSGLGRLLAEHMLGELQKKGVKVIDVRISNSLQVKKGYGEYGLSREMEELDYVQGAQARLVGTYSIADDQVLVNARLLHQEKGQVLSSGFIILKKNKMITELLKNSSQPAPTLGEAGMIEPFSRINSSR